MRQSLTWKPEMSSIQWIPWRASNKSFSGNRILKELLYLRAFGLWNKQQEVVAFSLNPNS